MQRHRRDDIAIDDKFPPRQRHHAGKGNRQLGPVAIFQAVHESARCVAIAADGARAGENRRIGDGLRRKELAANIDGKRRPQPLADRPGDKAHSAPARGAERMRLGGRGLAGDAGGRIDKPRRALDQLRRHAPADGKPAGKGREDVRGVLLHGRQPISCAVVAPWDQARRAGPWG